jgi:hypothetical protein
MQKQKQKILPIKGLEKFFSDVFVESHSIEVNVNSKVVELSKYKSTKHSLQLDCNSSSSRLYNHAKSFTSHYKIFG